MAISLAQRTRSITERLSELAAESESADCHRGVSKIVNETVLRASPVSEPLQTPNSLGHDCRPNHSGGAVRRTVRVTSW
jgi:hypothetical protein